MKKLNLENLERIQGGTQFWDGFCAVGTVVAIASGGTNMVANGIAAGCYLSSLM